MPWCREQRDGLAALRTEPCAVEPPSSTNVYVARAPYRSTALTLVQRNAATCQLTQAVLARVAAATEGQSDPRFVSARTARGVGAVARADPAAELLLLGVDIDVGLGCVVARVPPPDAPEHLTQHVRDGCQSHARKASIGSAQAQTVVVQHPPTRQPRRTSATTPPRACRPAL